MKFIPNYNVMYKGVFRESDEMFEIDEKDVEEMSAHGEIVEESTTHVPTVESEGPAEGKPRRGRPSKKEETK